jgi:hypothetical protein
MNKNAIWISTVSILLILVIGGVLVSAYYSGSKKNDTTQQQTTPTPSPSPTGDEVSTVDDSSPSPSAVASPTPSASPNSPVPTTQAITLPDSAKTFITNFYAAYKAKDRDRLAELFTSDTTNELKSLHSTLFKGVDLSGNPGGPTLFSTNSASQVATSYSILGSAPQGSNWVVTVREQRVDASGASIPDQTTLITLVPATSGQGTWLIDSYTHAAGSGKYEGFLLQ